MNFIFKPWRLLIIVCSEIIRKDGTFQRIVSKQIVTWRWNSTLFPNHSTVACNGKTRCYCEQSNFLTWMTWTRRITDFVTVTALKKQSSISSNFFSRILTLISTGGKDTVSIATRLTSLYRLSNSSATTWTQLAISLDYRSYYTAWRWDIFIFGV